MEHCESKHIKIEGLQNPGIYYMRTFTMPGSKCPMGNKESIYHAPTFQNLDIHVYMLTTAHSVLEIAAVLLVSTFTVVYALLSLVHD